MREDGKRASIDIYMDRQMSTYCYVKDGSRNRGLPTEGTSNHKDIIVSPKKLLSYRGIYRQAR